VGNYFRCINYLSDIGLESLDSVLADEEEANGEAETNDKAEANDEAEVIDEANNIFPSNHEGETWLGVLHLNNSFSNILCF